MTYAELKQAIQDFSESYEPSFIANLDLFIEQCEKRVYNSVQIPVLRKNVMGSMTMSSNYLACPDDFLSMYSIAVINTSANIVWSNTSGQSVGWTNTYGAIVNWLGTLFSGPIDTTQIAKAGDYSYLLNKDVSYMREAYPRASDTGLPKYYGIFGSQSSNLSELAIILAPTPDVNYNVELHYYYYPESITTTASGTTWLSDNYDPVLLYGSLREAIIYMKGEQDMVTYYEQKFQEALAQLKRLCDGLERGDAYRDGQTKIPLKTL